MWNDEKMTFGFCDVVDKPTSEGVDGRGGNLEYGKTATGGALVDRTMQESAPQSATPLAVERRASCAIASAGADTYCYRYC